LSAEEQSLLDAIEKSNQQQPNAEFVQSSPELSVSQSLAAHMIAMAPPPPQRTFPSKIIQEQTEHQQSTQHISQPQQQRQVFSIRNTLPVTPMNTQSVPAAKLNQRKTTRRPTPSKQRTWAMRNPQELDVEPIDEYEDSSPIASQQIIQREMKEDIEDIEAVDVQQSQTQPSQIIPPAEHIESAVVTDVCGVWYVTNPHRILMQIFPIHHMISPHRPNKAFVLVARG